MSSREMFHVDKEEMSVDEIIESIVQYHVDNVQRDSQIEINELNEEIDSLRDELKEARDIIEDLEARLDNA